MNEIDEVHWKEQGNKYSSVVSLLEFTCVKIVVKDKLFSILYLSFVWWLAAKMHKLLHRIVKRFPWGVQSMGLVVDIMFTMFKVIEQEPNKIVGED